MKQDVLNQLFIVIEERKKSDPENSYVASLYAKGTSKIAQKVGEEAVETCIEAIQGNKQKLAEESADLLFHLMVLWVDQGLSPDDITDVLQSRLGTSGHNEKASRQG